MSDDILFNNIPGSGLTAPIFSFEVNSGGQYSQIDRFIIVGHATAAGSIQPGTLVPVSDQNTVDQLTGGGSMLREMFRLAAKNAPAAPFWLLAVAEVGIAAQWALTVAALSGTGVATLMVAGEAITVAVGATDTPASVAAALAAAVNGYYDQLNKTMLHVTAVASGAVVTFTSRHKGVIFNETDFYCPSLAGSNLFALPGAVAIARTVDGAGAPVVGSALAPLADDPADYVVCPWTDPLSLGAYASFSGDVSGRWAWNRQSYGHVWAATSGTFASLVTLGLGLNDRHLSIIGRIHSPFAAYSLALPQNPVAGQTITIAGTAVTFGSGAGQVAVGADVATTLANLVTFLSVSADPGLKKFTYGAGTGALLLTAAVSGTLGNYLAVATTVPGATVSQTTASNGNPRASWQWDVGFASRLSPWLSDCVTGNVSRNQSGLVVQGIEPPRDRAVWPNYNGRNVLNNSGISTWTVGADGTLRIDKVVTTYRTGTAGQPDIVFRDIQSVYQVAGSLKFLRALLATEQSNKALATANPGSLGALTTPADVKGTLTHGVATLAARGVLQNADTTAKQLVVAINGDNPDRLDAYVPLERVSPFDVLAANATVYQRLPAAA